MIPPDLFRLSRAGRLCFRFGCAALIALTTPAGPAFAQSLAARVRALVSDTKLGATRMGVVVMDASTGEVLASVRGDEAFIPASNMKLVTSGAALAVLGPDFKFRTAVVYDGGFRSAGIAGRVVVRGSGDPALGDPKLLASAKQGVEWVLDQWISAMKSAGVPAGVELVIDDRVFDRQFVHPSWPAEQLNRWYCAEVAGVNFHTNLLSIFADPKEAGRPPTLRFEPVAPWIEVRNRARSITQGQQTAWASRAADNSISVFGDFRFASSPIEITVSNMPDFVGRLVADRMAAAGIRPARVRVADENEDLSGGREIHVFTTDLATILKRCNVDSYNLYAEALLKRMGHEVTKSPGSWSNGASVVRMVLLEHLGVQAGPAFIVADGSGMSRNNRATPRMLAVWLKSLLDDSKIGEPFLASLPLAREEGTLRRRFRTGSPRCEVRAKTGYLSGVSAITGVATDPATGRRLIFSIISNDKPNGVQLDVVRAVEERVILLADGWIRGEVSPGAAGAR